jgi:hypothetical protein
MEANCLTAGAFASGLASSLRLWVWWTGALKR